MTLFQRVKSILGKDGNAVRVEYRDSKAIIVGNAGILWNSSTWDLIMNSGLYMYVVSFGMVEIYDTPKLISEYPQLIYIASMEGIKVEWNWGDTFECLVKEDGNQSALETVISRARYMGYTVDDNNFVLF